jgi:hypothetical protein
MATVALRIRRNTKWRHMATVALRTPIVPALAAATGAQRRRHTRWTLAAVFGHVGGNGFTVVRKGA